MQPGHGLPQVVGPPRVAHDVVRHREPLGPRRLGIERGLRRFTIVPLRLYFNDAGKVKVELGLARGKRDIDKRRAIAEREADRDLQREIKERERRK